MDRSCKNIIEAGITLEEFNELYDGEMSKSQYLSSVTDQRRRYWDLKDLALLRNEYDLAEYFRDKSGMSIVDWCD